MVGITILITYVYLYTYIIDHSSQAALPHDQLDYSTHPCPIPFSWHRYGLRDAVHWDWLPSHDIWSGANLMPER